MPSPKSKRVTVRELICDGLGYCCEYAFFRMEKRTGLIAERLGVDARTVRYHKMAYKDGDLVCEKLIAGEKCLKGRLF